MTYTTSPPSHRGNRGTTNRSPISMRRVIGLLLSLASIVLALLGIYFSLHKIAVLLVAVIIFLFGARMFALWLGEHARTLPSSGPWKAPVFAPGQRGADSSGSLLPPQFPGNPAPWQAPPPGTAEFATLPPSIPGSPYRVLNNYELPTEAQPTATTAATPLYRPIAEDEFFSLDQPITNERCFLLPKEGDPLVECQDRYALLVNNGYRCYAVADGVAGSFVPGPWARVVAKSFVERATMFTGKDDFQRWLADCSRQWHTWIEQRWVPTINALRERNGDRARDWSQEIRQGAQTTLIGCVLDFPRRVESHAFASVAVFAIGDSEFFHFSPDRSGGWSIQGKFPYQKSGDFDAHPSTLVTAALPELVDRSWMRRQSTAISAFPGDLLVLATDTLAQWILTQIEQQTDRWQVLLSITAAGEFEQYIRREFHRDQVEDDDVTMLVIPI